MGLFAHLKQFNDVVGKEWQAFVDLVDADVSDESDEKVFERKNGEGSFNKFVSEMFDACVASMAASGSKNKDREDKRKRDLSSTGSSGGNPKRKVVVTAAGDVKYANDGTNTPATDRLRKSRWDQQPPQTAEANDEDDEMETSSYEDSEDDSKSYPTSSKGPSRTHDPRNEKIKNTQATCMEKSTQ